MLYHFIAMKNAWHKITLGETNTHGTGMFPGNAPDGYCVHADITPSHVQSVNSPKMTIFLIYMLCNNLYSGCLLCPVSNKCIGGKQSCMMQ